MMSSHGVSWVWWPPGDCFFGGWVRGLGPTGGFLFLFVLRVGGLEVTGGKGAAPGLKKKQEKQMAA